MVRERIEERVGSVALIGAASAPGYLHSFTKLGRDGTGKGNIASSSSGAAAHGVVYRLTGEQMLALHAFERGYEQVTLAVTVTVMVTVTGPAPPQPDRSARRGAQHDGSAALASRMIEAETFRAIRPVEPLAPTQQYVAFYERGIRECGLPDEYLGFILGQARALWRAE